MATKIGRAVAAAVMVGLAVGCGGDDGGSGDDRPANGNPPTPQGDDRRNPDGSFNATAGLPAYPGALDIRIDRDGDDTEVRFRSTDSLESVFDFFDRELTEDGWQRTELDRDDDRIEARYVRDGRRVKVEVEREDTNLYVLEVDLDDDGRRRDRDDADGRDDDDRDDDDDREDDR